MDVELKIPNPPSTIAPGYTFEGSITIEGETKILLVPQSAITTTRGSSSVTKKNSDGTTTRVTVTVKYLGEGMSQLLSGDVKVGDTLIVRRTDTSNPFAAITGGGPQMRMF
ncbi:MAG: efflux transporter periplasmic adaptor subunit, partial [Sphaerochaeta sp.]|nr:efflux transporter periplasmic adaptor subunit [Sphaerochaeta sp.]